ncbi:MAG: polyketide synthase [Kiritimatiellae bacterium]|nr:polyketide synthase [Kiritimatiellia bacterium]
MTDTPIAIVGMSCRFAGCPDPEALWDVVMNRRTMLSKMSDEVALPYGSRGIFGRTYPQCIGQLADLYSCRPSMQNFPRQVNSGENQDLYFATQLAFDAMADASKRVHSRSTYRGSVHVGYAPPFNASTVNWLQHTSFLDQTMEIMGRFMRGASSASMELLRAKLAESLPSPNAASFLLGAGYRFASWIARECSFTGSATVVDAGMLTGAAALTQAMDDLRSGRADVALAGALNPPLSRAYLEGLAGEVEFTSENELMPFAEAPSGTVPGEGGAFFVLKRRADALRDRNKIYALVKSVVIGHNPPDDPSVIFSETLEKGGALPRTVQLIESSNAGIREAEKRDVESISRIWGVHKPGGPLVGIGSIAGNIGNTLRASMFASLVKVALALKHRVLPAQVEVNEPGHWLSRLDSSAYLLLEPRPWIIGDSANPRRAVVLGSNFDAVNPVGQTNRSGRSAAILLEEEPEDRR